MVFTSFKKLAGAIWKPNYERAGISANFTPEFYKIIGIEDPNEYDNVLRFLYKKAEAFTGSVFFAEEIPPTGNFDLIIYLHRELATMDLYHLEGADITVFDDPQMNHLFLCALDQTVILYEGKNSFLNESVKIDFITKLILWMNTYIKPIEKTITESVCPKCLYYGDITKHEAYFLILLRLIGFDVLYINPLRDPIPYLNEINVVNVLSYQNISQIGSIMQRVNNAQDTNLEISTTAQLMDEIQQEIFTNGVFRPWQLKNHQIKPCKKKYTIYDLKSNIGEPAKVRDGFRVEGNVVYMPNMFFQIDGVDSDISEYAELVTLVQQQPNTKTYNHMTIEYNGQPLGGLLRMGPEVSDDVIFQLVFCRVGVNQYEIDSLRNMSFYKWSSYSPDIERKLVDALNRTLQGNIFRTPLTDRDELRFIADILYISEDIIKLLDSFDYSDKIPKVVIFLENEDFLNDREILLLSYIYELGFDVIIFNPSGLKSISSILNDDVFSYVKNDKIYNGLTLQAVSSKKKSKGFLSFLFNK